MTINIMPVASGTFLTREACLELTETGRLPPGAFITLSDPATLHEKSGPMTAAEAMQKIREDEINAAQKKSKKHEHADNVVPLHPEGSDDAA